MEVFIVVTIFFKAFGEPMLICRGIQRKAWRTILVGEGLPQAVAVFAPVGCPRVGKMGGERWLRRVIRNDFSLGKNSHPVGVHGASAPFSAPLCLCLRLPARRDDDLLFHEPPRMTRRLMPTFDLSPALIIAVRADGGASLPTVGRTLVRHLQKKTLFYCNCRTEVRPTVGIFFRLSDYTRVFFSDCRTEVPTYKGKLVRFFY